MTHAAHLLPPQDSHLRLIMSQDSDRPDTIPPDTHREAPTHPLASERPLKPEGLEQLAERAPQTAMRPPPANPWDTSFLLQDDNTFSRAVRLIADAARANESARDERRQYELAQLSKQDEILEAIRRADQNGTRNYELLRDQIRHLKDSDIKQDERLKEGDQRFDRIEQSIADLRAEMLAALPIAVTETLAPYVARIEALERDLANARAAQTGTPPTG